MVIMSSFRLKNYFKGSFKLTVSILMNVLAIFLQHLLKICMIPSSETNEHHTTTNSKPCISRR